MVIMKGIARVIDKSTLYLFLFIYYISRTLTRSGQGHLVITKSVVNLYYFKIAR